MGGQVEVSVKMSRKWEEMTESNVNPIMEKKLFNGPWQKLNVWLQFGATAAQHPVCPLHTQSGAAAVQHQVRLRFSLICLVYGAAVTELSWLSAHSLPRES